MRLSVDRTVDRSSSTVDRTVDRTQQRAGCFQSVDRAVDRVVNRDTLVHVVHTGRPGGRLAFSTGRPCGRPVAFLACFNASFAPFDFRSLCYLPLSPLSPLFLQKSQYQHLLADGL